MAWLGTWARRWKLVIPGNKVLETNTNFPVVLHLGADAGPENIDVREIFDDLGNDSLKIAVTSDDGVTQLPVEIAFWDAVIEHAEVWVRLDFLTLNTEKCIFLYFDPLQPDNTTYVGGVGSAVGQSVWTPNGYVAVYHLNELSGQYLDSGPNVLNSTSVNVATRTRTGLLTPYAPEFSSPTHSIELGTQTEFNILGSKTVELLAVSDVGDSSWRFGFEHWGGSGDIDNWYELGKSNTGNAMHWRWVACTTGCDRRMDSTFMFTPGDWHYFAGVYDTTINQARIHIDENTDSNAAATDPTGGSGPSYIGNNHLSENWDGAIDEVRVSDVDRTEEWLTMTNFTMRDIFVSFMEAMQALAVNRVEAVDGKEINTVPKCDIDFLNTVQWYDCPVCVPYSLYGATSGDGTSISVDIGAAGNARLVAITVVDESTPGETFQGTVTVDGKTCTQQVVADNPDGLGNHQELHTIHEAALGASNGTVTISYSGGDANWAIHVQVHYGILNNTPDSTGKNNTTIGTPVVTQADVPFDNMLVMYGASIGNGGAAMSGWTSPLVERTERNSVGGEQQSGTASGIEPAALIGKNYSVDFSGGTLRTTGIVAVFRTDCG